jgi:hypothetical protein|tara:strand:+ start:502 stop:720 length:219 start_codon:yes stop_codon:yes gene_type:complete
MAINYRKLYEENNGKIPENWEVHHIDFNHNNNNLKNLIAVPSMVHMVIHQSGFIPRDEIENLIQIYEDNKQT